MLQEGQADTFLMNQLPFEADIRMASYAAFTEKHFKLPHRGQTAAMDAAIDAMMLADGEIRCQSGHYIRSLQGVVADDQDLLCCSRALELPKP